MAATAAQLAYLLSAQIHVIPILVSLVPLVKLMEHRTHVNVQRDSMERTANLNGVFMALQVLAGDVKMQTQKQTVKSMATWKSANRTTLYAD